jgi:hypothetical protein
VGADSVVTDFTGLAQRADLAGQAAGAVTQAAAAWERTLADQPGGATYPDPSVERAVDELRDAWGREVEVHGEALREWEQRVRTAIHEQQAQQPTLQGAGTPG